MSMSYAWLIMLGGSIFCALLRGTAAETGAAALSGAQSGVTLCLSISGAVCLWSGLARVMEQSGLAERLARLLRPLLRRLFPSACNDPVALQNLSGNFTANLLGLGNAATPPGIAAAKRMHALSAQESASDELCRFIVLNTASIQLVPATVAAVRSSLGAARPFDVLPAVWLSSACALGAGLLAARVFARWCKT